LIRKVLPIGIILLFVGTPIIPAIAQDNEKTLPTSRGDWLYVGGNGLGNYTKIQDAIDNATEGDTVFVYSGWYNESILINKSIVVSGQDRNTTFIIGGNASSLAIVFIEASNVEFRGFTIQKQHLGIGGISCSYSQIQDNYVRMCEYGIGIGSTDSVLISNNIIQNCTSGIGISYTKNVMIKENLIEGNEEAQYGISVAFTTHKNSIIKNNVTNYDCGIDLGRAYFTLIKENNLIRNKEQASFWDSYFSIWFRNYWNEPKLLPKVILGRGGGSINSFQVINIDWRPALKPYEIP
jgi:Periplasmic copper-binding protein (NosD)